jgi:hypothetical protein
MAAFSPPPSGGGASLSAMVTGTDVTSSLARTQSLLNRKTDKTRAVHGPGTVAPNSLAPTLLLLMRDFVNDKDNFDRVMWT